MWVDCSKGSTVAESTDLFCCLSPHVAGPSEPRLVIYYLVPQEGENTRALHAGQEKRKNSVQGRGSRESGLWFRITEVVLA